MQEMVWAELGLVAKGVAVWTVTHVAAVHAYQWLCVPASVWGLIRAPLMIATPHCRALVWVIDGTSMTVFTAWTTVGLLVSSRLFDAFPVTGQGVGGGAE